ncbi:hypothetical protein LH991_01235 [Schleiferilactobacillus harbinensis]|uniref:Uncharacterized protein n=1 Tax=Schleiferilactobacillus harbinensis DSM 16991 TaxID=1122147 RepID=A0A0R1XC46_9LACO|nr:hypothetical protein [Schleiferilactobacillus harbinensis]KRM27552.1 hypothetical protein FC91_GL002468 [Schleiferilactobacillus harbinensis DSM 16991]QFR62709.1 hypothetical protein LH991_01235 [Schleiferilactobacillus harbinensis]
MNEDEFLWGEEYMDKMRSLPHYAQGHQIVEIMVLYHASTEQILAFTGLIDNEFAAMLAGDGAFTDQQYENLYAQIRAHGHRRTKGPGNEDGRV